jgi:hypothetical protein
MADYTYQMTDASDAPEASCFGTETTLTNTPTRGVPATPITHESEMT